MKHNMRVSIEERFFSKVKKTAGCWEWLGAKSSGYGSFALKSGQTIAAYRWSFEFIKGPVPHGLQLDHLCRNRGCVNPEHLEIVSQRTNVLRGLCPPAINSRKTHCIKGHAFTSSNTYQRKNGGGRKCRECMRIQGERYRANRRGAA